MFCPFCGHQNREGKKFCRQCGRTVPAPRSNIGTTPLPHYNTFPEDLLESVDSGFPMASQTNPNNPLIDQSIYNSFSPSVDNINKSPSPINSEWQPDIATKTSEEYLPISESEDPLSQFTQQLLPDTVGFEVPKIMPPLANNANYPKPNGTKASASEPGFKTDLAEKFAKNYPLPSNNGFGNFNNSDEYAPTDEMEALSERNWEKTEDIPVLTERTADMPVLTEKTADIPILAEREKTADIPIIKQASPMPSFAPTNATNLTNSTSSAAKPTTIRENTPISNPYNNTSNNASNNASRPLTSILSVNTNAPGSLVEDAKRTERIILIIIVIVALIGVGIMVWLLVLRPSQVGYNLNNNQLTQLKAFFNLSFDQFT